MLLCIQKLRRFMSISVFLKSFPTCYSSTETQNSPEVLSIIFLSIGALSLVISLILGIKWKRFRYRMTFQNTPGENVISIRRHSTTPTIRENCCEGKYRHSTTEELITSGNDIQPTLRNSSTYNVKLESCKYLLQLPLIRLQLLSRYYKNLIGTIKVCQFPYYRILLLIIIFFVIS